MAPVIKKSITPAFEPFQIVIDIDSPEKAVIYGKFFDDSAPVAKVLYNMLLGSGLSYATICRILGDEISANEWNNTFRKYMP